MQTLGGYVDGIAVWRRADRNVGDVHSELGSAVVGRIRDAAAAAAAASASDAYKRFGGSSDGESIIPASTTSTAAAARRQRAGTWQSQLELGDLTEKNIGPC